MPKIVILGSCRFEPYEILVAPNKLDPILYDKDHEKAYENACKVFYPAIKKADEVWVYALDGIGEHTRRDIEFAKKLGKVIKIIREGEAAMMEELDEVFTMAKLKAVIKINVEGYTATPWVDFPRLHLEKRLNDEFHEWLKSKEADELLDIINLAAFVYLAKKREGSGGRR